MTLYSRNQMDIILLCSFLKFHHHQRHFKKLSKVLILIYSFAVVNHTGSDLVIVGVFMCVRGGVDIIFAMQILLLLYKCICSNL